MSDQSAPVRTCPECDGALQPEGGETLCTDCGLIVSEDWLDRGPEWRSFQGDGDSRERTGAPLTRSRHDRGLTTEIGRSARLSGRKRRRVARMRIQHDRARIRSKAERNRVYAFTEIHRLASALSLPDSIRDAACALFESAQDENLLHGRSIEGFAAASLYAACRVDSLSRTMEEVVAAARADEGELKAAYDAMNRALGLPTGPIDPREYLPRFASELDLPQSIERTAHEFVERATDLGLTNGRNPCGVAAACLYAAATERDYPLTQSDAATVAGVTPVTVRSSYTALSG